MMTIAVVNVGLPGHVNPTLGVVAELVRRGHRVRYCCSPALAADCRGAGAEFVAYPTELATAAQTRRPDLLSHLEEECARTLPALVDAFARDRPDVVLHNFISFGGRLAGESLSIPSVTFFTSYALNASFNVFSKALVMNTPPGGVESARARLDAVCRRFGCAPIDLTAAIARPPNASLAFIPRRFQPLEETFDDSYHFVGPCLHERNDPGPGGFPSGMPGAPAGARNVLIATGTIFRYGRAFYEACLRAFADPRWRVVMSVGTEAMAAELGEVPANVRISAHVRQLALLRRADLMVSHGGMNSVIEAFAFGVPMINLPQTGEHIFTARRVEELGLGRRLRLDQLTAETLGAAAEDIVGDPGYRTRLADMQRDARDAGGAARAADVVESGSVRAVAGAHGGAAARGPVPGG